MEVAKQTLQCTNTEEKTAILETKCQLLHWSCTKALCSQSGNPPTKQWIIPMCTYTAYTYLEPTKTEGPPTQTMRQPVNGTRPVRFDRTRTKKYDLWMKLVRGKWQEMQGCERSDLCVIQDVWPSQYVPLAVFSAHVEPFVHEWHSLGHSMSRRHNLRSRTQFK